MRNKLYEYLGKESSREGTGFWANLKYKIAKRIPLSFFFFFLSFAKTQIISSRLTAEISLTSSEQLEMVPLLTVYWKGPSPRRVRLEPTTEALLTDSAQEDNWGTASLDPPSRS